LNDRQTIHQHGLSQDHELIIHAINTADQACDIFTKHHPGSSGGAIVVPDTLDSDPHANAQVVFTRELVFHPDFSLRGIELDAVEYHAPKTCDRAGAGDSRSGRRWGRRRRRCRTATTPTPTPTSTSTTA